MVTERIYYEKQSEEKKKKSDEELNEKLTEEM